MSRREGRIVSLLTQVRDRIRRYRLQLILALRVTVAALSAFALAQALHLHLPLWAVLTSLIVTQMSLGRSLKVASDYLIGTIGGVAYGGALAILIPHESEWALLAVLALAVAPLAFIASFRANFNVLPVTAIIVLLVPGMQHVSPGASAIDRILEVTVGGAVGFVVSFLLFPSRADAITIQAAADMLDLLADALANAIMPRLKNICCGLNFAPFRGQHCTVVEMQVITTASAALRFTAAVSRNGRFIDMLPLTPGSFTFNRDVAAASASTASAK